MSMSLADALEQSDRRPGTPCAVTTLIDQLRTTNPDLADELLAAARGTEPIAKLHRATAYLTEQGVLAEALSQNSIGRHRRRECRCP
jgi:hypothetical protein